MASEKAVPGDDMPGTGRTGDPAGPPDTFDEKAADVDGFSRAVAELAESDLDSASRRKAISRMVTALRGRGVGRLFQPGKAVRWVTDAVADLAPHVPVRDLDTLRRHYPGLDGDALAERLVRNAARSTAGIGAIGGGVGSVQWAVPPTLLSTPVLLAVETVAVIGLELKLIGELHQVYGQPVVGTTTQRSAALLQSWAHKRGVNPFLPGGGVASILGTAARKELRDMIVKRLGRNLTTLGPLLTGAAVASFLNRRSTKALGEAVRRDLRLRHRPALPGPGLPPALPPAPPPN
ncbi:hypothetical protein HDA40_003267 [Hamadaea flava]|uniref:EcsC family protein n=1 Tax=Hamadaea flava TaxID=1742688 RepID=A0ABV8LKC3_9ACTN|nr:hypothetical protein [Hamadaea flava]MCP2324760.1 hypothetical protein [Hamadaea flava]